MTPAHPRPAAPEARAPDAPPKHLPEYRDVVAALMLPRELTACEAMELADALLAAALRAHPAGEPSEDARLAAMLLCEVGRVDDPRLRDVQPMEIREAIGRGPSEWAATPRPLTNAEVIEVLAVYRRTPTGGHQR
jgi:hypothetical protein